MIIEKEVIAYLAAQTGKPVSAETPANPPAVFIIVEKTGGQQTANGLRTGTVAIQCNASTMLAASTLAEQVKAYMKAMPNTVSNVFEAACGEPYNFTNQKTAQRRYQLVCDLSYI